MARRVRWTPSALTDLEEIAGYIARDSRYYAAAFVRNVKMFSRSLEIFAERARIVPELGEENIRELLFGDYRIIFRIRENEIQITAIIHQARDLRRIL